MRPSFFQKIFGNTWPAASLLVALALLLELIVRMQIVPDYLLASPSQVGAALWTESEAFKAAFFETLLSTAIGFGSSVILGSLLAFGLARFQWLATAVFPFSVLFQTVPIVAIAPLLVVWFGFGSRTVQICSFIVSIFPILANVLAGLNQTPKSLLELFHSYRATPTQILWHLRVPLAIPYLLAGMEISAGLAVIGSIIGEFVAGSGLGSLIDSARAQQRVDLMFGAILLASLLGVALIILIRGLKVVFRRYFETIT